MRLLLLLPLLFIGVGTTLIAQDNAKYIGVWRAGYTTGHYLGSGPLADGFESVNTYQYASRSLGQEVKNYAVYAAVRTRVVVGDWAKTKALPAKNYSSAQGEHIVSLETNTHSSEPQAYFHAIIGRGRIKQELVRFFGWESFTADWRKRTEKGMRLKEVVSFRQANRQVFVGLYQPGTGGHYLYSYTGWKAFTNKWAELGKKNYRLVDVETFRVGNSYQYIGVWAPGKDDYALLNVTGFQAFSKQFAVMKKKGLRLIDIDVIN